MILHFESEKKTSKTHRIIVYSAPREVSDRELDSNGDAMGLNIETVKASTLNNPYLDESEKERFQRQYGNTSREGQALHGGFASGEGNLLNREQLSFVDKSNYDGGENLVFYIGVDLAYVESKAKANDSDGDYTAAVLVGHDRSNGKAYIIDLERERGANDYFEDKAGRMACHLTNVYQGNTDRVRCLRVRNAGIRRARRPDHRGDCGQHRKAP